MTIRELPTPCYVIDEGKLEDNLRILDKVRRDTGCKILLAQKAFSCYYFYPLIGTYLDGTTASGLFEARLGYEEMGRENHVFSPAYRAEDMDELGKICGHVVCNSMAQLKKWHDWKMARLGNAGGAGAPAWACGSTRSAPPRRDTPSTTPARRAHVWE